MATAGFVIFLVIVAMDAAAGILSIEAEKSQNEVKHERVGSLECKEASSDAFTLGLAAIVLLTIAHATESLFVGCTRICSTDSEELERSSASRQVSFACLIFSWFAVAVGLPTLIIGTLANSKSKESCGILRRHLLSVAGILCFFHALCFIVYYSLQFNYVYRFKSKDQLSTTTVSYC